MIRIVKAMLCVTSILIIFQASYAYSAVTTYSNENIFTNDVAVTAFENFETYANDTTHNTIMSTNYFDVTTTPLNGGASFLFLGQASGGPHPTDGSIGLMTGSDSGDGYILTFNLLFPVTAVGFDITDAGETDGILSFNSNSGHNIDILSSPPYLPSGNEIFWGIKSDTSFTQFSIIKTQLWDGIGIDRIHLAVAPEPISSILFVAGGALLAGRRYVKRKKKA